MKFAGLQEEKKLQKKGYKKIACFDEAGRGPLAGPVVAAAVITDISKIAKKILLPKLKDSKQLSSVRREYFYKVLNSHPAIKWGLGKVSEKIIDKINILEATKLAMERALKDLKKKGAVPDFLVLDGIIKLNIKTPQKAIIKADEKVFSCAAASIMAKVERDWLMEKYHQKYPHYGFDKNKGYGTEYHLKMIKKRGLSKIHRKSFGPVRACRS